MKLSTRIKKYLPASIIFGTGRYSDPNGDCTAIPIVLMVDGKREWNGEDLWSYSLDVIDQYHHSLTKDDHCTLLPPNECPVYNGKEIIMHYTSTTYKDWCNQLVHQ